MNTYIILKAWRLNLFQLFSPLGDIPNYFTLVWILYVDICITGIHKIFGTGIQQNIVVNVVIAVSGLIPSYSEMTLISSLVVL